MKKIYSTLALASLIVASAAAASPKVAGIEKSMSKQMQTQALELNLQQVEGKVAKESKNVETRALSSIEDICMPYNVPEWYDPFEGDWTTEVVSFTIAPAEGNSVYLICNGATFAQPLLATVDLAAQTLTIKTDDNQGLYYTEQNGSLGLELMEIEWGEPDADGNVKGKLVETQSVTVKITDNHEIDFSSVFLMWKWVEKGSYNQGYGRFVLTPFDFFKFNASDWTSVGNAKFTDGFCNPAFYEQYQIKEAYDVPFYVNNKTEGLCLLANPYSQPVWTADEYFEKSTPGYLVFDISNPDCVPLSPLVGSGAWMTLSGQLTELFFFNTEGLDVMGGRSTESIIEEIEENMNPFTETLADYLSSYDADTRTVTLKNCMFGISDSPIAGYIWQANTPLTSTIVLPDMSGVNDIIADDANAVVKYYNLQGMEVAKPEAGQLVIMKKGSKASKFIAK